MYKLRIGGVDNVDTDCQCMVEDGDDRPVVVVSRVSAFTDQYLLYMIALKGQWQVCMGITGCLNRFGCC